MNLSFPVRLASAVAAACILAACATNPTASPRAGERYAIIQTDVPRTAHGIFPVVIYNFDGKEIRSERRVHRVAPGTHSIKARAVVDRRYVRGPSRDLSRDDNAPLVYNFQSGTRYFVGLKADSPRRADWELVVWKSEEIEEGSLKFD